MTTIRSGHADIAVGTRYGVSDWHVKRQRISQIATDIGKRILKANLSDLMSGYFALSRQTLMAAATLLPIRHRPVGQIWGGWPAMVRTMISPGPFRFMPEYLGAVALVLALFGWLSWRSRTGLFGTLLFMGYGLFFMLFCRPDNFYWGFMTVPTLLVGLAFLPRALTDLRCALTRKLDFVPA